MNRSVVANLLATVVAPARVALQVAIANPGAYAATELIEISLDGRPAAWTERTGAHGNRIWVIDAEPGSLVVDYQATLSGMGAAAITSVDEELLYLRPSRYCESDRLIGFAGRHFRGVPHGRDLVNAVTSWVGQQLEYVSGSSGPSDGAVDTLLAARGVCRDYVHLTVALLRAQEIPARLAAVYAPGLQPMDFHAVAEVLLGGAWYIVDPTLLAPRASLVRIATGRDASDTAFLSSYGGFVVLETLTVGAIVGGELPSDDVASLVQLR